MIYTFEQHTPSIDERAWVAQSSDVIGNVTLAPYVSVFYHSVVRGDAGSIIIEEGSNIQDNCTLHCDLGHSIFVGKNVTVGHNCILHGCHIEDECLIGMGAIVMDDAHIETHCIIGAGALISKGMHIPSGSIVMGIPGKIVKVINEADKASIIENAVHYQKLARIYKAEEE